MKFKRLYLTYLSLTVLSIPAYAINTGKGVVTSLFPRSSAGETYVVHTSVSSVNTTCSLNDYFVLKKANPMSEDLLSALLLAYSTKNPNVSILLEGCDANNRAIIDAVILE